MNETEIGKGFTMDSQKKKTNKKKTKKSDLPILNFKRKVNIA